METTVKTKPFKIQRGPFALATLELFWRVTGLKIAIIIVVCLPLIAIFADPRSRLLVIFGIGSLCFSALFFAVITVYRIFDKKARYLYDSTRQIELSDSTIHISVEGMGESTVNWSAFSSIQPVSGWTVFMQGRNAVVVIPNSAFESKDTLNVFRELIERKRLDFRSKK